MLYLADEGAAEPIHFEERGLRGRIDAAHDTPELRAVLADPDAFTHSDGVSLLKNNARSRVVRGRVDGRYIVVKQSHAKTAGKAFKRAVIPSRAARGWYAAQMVESLGVATAGAIAYVDRRTGPFRGRSWLVSEWIPGKDARTHLSAPDLDPAERTRLIRAIAAIYARLHGARITHGDNRPENFLVSDGQPIVIDLDVTVLHPRWSFVFHRYARRDVRILLARWHRAPPIAEEFRRVFREYGLDGP